MRVSFLQQANRYQDNLQTSLSKYIQSQDKLIKQREVLSPEDKPTNYTAAYSLQRTLDDMGQFMENADGAIGWLQASEVNINEAVDITKKARELAVAGNVGHLTREAAQALGKDTLNLYNRMFELGNSQHMGRYIFGGFDTNDAPFQDRINSVSSITQYFGRGGDVSTRTVFGDFSELKSGEYTVEVSMQNGRCYMRLQDEYGNPIMIDSNGSDDTLKSGNDMTDTSVFEYEPGKVINTGVGVTLTLPKDPAMLFSGLKYTFRYQAGAADSYFGDNGILYNKIGYNQHVAMNFPGNELFMQNNKILRSGALMTATGVTATTSTRFSELKNANTNIGDSISFRGLDHLGRPLGSATVAGSRSVTYNMEGTTEDERTLTFGFGGSYYQIVLPEKSYENMDELLINVRRELARAKFAGSQTPMNYMGIEGLEANHFAEITTISPTPFEVDLSNHISVARDGDRLSFTTAATGDHTLLSVTGKKYNTVGFDNKTVAAQGQDTVFELGYDFKQQDIPNLSNSHGQLQLSDLMNGFTFDLNGKTVAVPALYEEDPIMFKPALEHLINLALNDAGFDYGVNARVEGPLGGPMTLTFSLQNTNFSRETHLATKLNFPCKDEYLMSSSPRQIPAFPQEKNIGDLMQFIKELYKDTVDVSLDEGRISVTDKRTGANPMTLQVTENLQGMTLPIVDNAPVVMGSYNGMNNDKWLVQYSVMQGIPESTRDIRVEVTNDQGVKVVDMAVMGYHGEPVELRNGVSIVFDDSVVFDRAFELNLTSNSSLNLGDMAVIADGANGNALRNLMNLSKALEVGVGLDGADSPSQWRDENSRSTAIPSFENDFGGNFNAKWEYNVEAVNGQTEFYIQDEFVHKTGRLRFDQQLMNNTYCNMAFTVQFFDETQQKMVEQEVCVPIGIATSEDEVAKLVMDYVREEHPALALSGIRVVYNDGRLEFRSGSGARNINVIMNDSTTTYAMGLDDMPQENSLLSDFSNGKTAVFDIRYFDGEAWNIRTVNLDQDYGSSAGALAAINTQLEGTGVQAALDSSKILSFASIKPAGSASDTRPYFYDVLKDPTSSLGFGNSIQSYIKGDDMLQLNMVDLSSTQRTLTFQYDLSNFSIEVPAKVFNNVGEIVEEINSQLSGKTFPMLFEAVTYGEKGIGFKVLEPEVLPLSIQGDHAGTLGFRKRGDAITVSVLGEDRRGESQPGQNAQREVIQNISMDTASKYYDVADGLKLAFDAGSLYAAEGFTGTIGSGVGVELGKIDIIENQLLGAYTKVGNRIGRAESTKTFNTAVTTSAEKQKADQLGSSSEDVTALAMKMEQAKSAYEYAMSITSQASQFSIMDYMR